MSLPETLLSWARVTAARSEFQVEGAWPRAAALLGRQALEEALDEFWDRQIPQMVAASRATQLACLKQYLHDPNLVAGIRTAWGALSRACHHHPYDLAPTAHELEYWFAYVEDLISRLADTEGGVTPRGGDFVCWAVCQVPGSGLTERHTESWNC